MYGIAKDWKHAWVKINDYILEHSDKIDTFQDGVRRGIRELSIIQIKNNDLRGMKVQDVGYTNSKLTHLNRSYLDTDQLDKALKQIEERINKGDKVFNIGMHFKKDGKPGSTTGPCILSMTIVAQLPQVDIYINFRASEVVRRLYADCIFLSGLIDIISSYLKPETKGGADPYIHLMCPWMYVSGTYGPLLDLFEPFHSKLKKG